MHIQHTGINVQLAVHQFGSGLTIRHHFLDLFHLTTQGIQTTQDFSPITEFGLARTLERTLEAINRVGPDPPASVRYLHLKSLEQLDQPVHHVQIDYPPGSATKHQRQDLFIGAETRLPAGTFLWLPDGHLDAAYLYTELDLSIDLADEDFSITARRLRTDPKPPTSHSPPYRAGS